MKNRKNSTENFVWVIDLNNKTWGFWGVLIWHIKVKNSYENSFEWCSDDMYLIWQTWDGNHCRPFALGTWVTQYRAGDLYAWPQSCRPLCLPRPGSEWTKEWCTLPQPQMKSEWSSNNTTGWIISNTCVHVYPFPQKNLSLVSKTNVFLF